MNVNAQKIFQRNKISWSVSLTYIFKLMFKQTLIVYTYSTVQCLKNVSDIFCE